MTTWVVNSSIPRAIRAGGGYRPPARVVIPAGTSLALLALWEVFSRSGVFPPELPPFSEVANWLISDLAHGSFWLALSQTVWHWFAGLLIGGLVGVALGVAIGVVPLLQRLLNTPFELVRPIPAVVYLPPLIYVMGATSQTAILLAAVGALWPMLFQTYYGVQAIDPKSIETGRVFGLTAMQRFWSIVLPSLLPYAATGVRISSSLALIVAVSIELIGGVSGLGAELADYAQNSVYTGMYSILLVSGLLGLALNVVLERTEKRLLRWHISHRVVSK